MFLGHCDNMIIIPEIFFYQSELVTEKNLGIVGIPSLCKELGNRRCITELHR